MRHERPEDVDRTEDDALALFIRDGLDRAVAQEGERLADLERQLLRRLSGRRRRTSLGVRLKPAWALAAAALFAAGFLLGTWIAEPLGSRGVEFALYAPQAERVALAISYPVAGHPEWEAIPMERRGGLWSISLELPPGTYEYGFKIDGQWWAHDPAADYLVMGAGDTVNAVREVSAGGRT